MLTLFSGRSLGTEIQELLIRCGGMHSKGSGLVQYHGNKDSSEIFTRIPKCQVGTKVSSTAEMISGSDKTFRFTVHAGIRDKSLL